jgi:hypothetical protein
MKYVQAIDPTIYQQQFGYLIERTGTEKHIHLNLSFPRFNAPFIVSRCSYVL